MLKRRGDFMFCPKCGKQIKDDDIFCAYCGESINHGAQAPANPGPAQQTPYTLPNQAAPTPNNYTYPQQPNVFPKSGGSKNAVVTSDTTESEATTVTEETTSGTEPTTESTTVTAATTTTTETTTEPETTATETATEPTTAISADSAAKAEAAAYSTNDRPTFAEFDWCAGQFGLVSTPPPNAEVIENYYATGGGWKSMIVYEDTTGVGITREIDNIEIFFDGNRVTLTVDWYYVEPPYSEAYYMDEGTVTQFSGAVNGSVIHTAADVNGETVTIDLHSFWKTDGKQYAIGALYLPDGTSNYLALVRK